MYQLTTPEGNSVKVTNKDLIWNAIMALQYDAPKCEVINLTIGFPAETIEVTTESLKAACTDLRRRFA